MAGVPCRMARCRCRLRCGPCRLPARCTRNRRDRGAAGPLRHDREARGRQHIALSGRIAAEDEVAVAFRIPGRLIERTVNVGDRVRPGQVIARLEQMNERNQLLSAQAALKRRECRPRARPRRVRPPEVADRRGFHHACRLDQATAAFRAAEAKSRARRRRSAWRRTWSASPCSPPMRRRGRGARRRARRGGAGGPDDRAGRARRRRGRGVRGAAAGGAPRLARRRRSTSR